MARITKRFVDALTTPEGADAFHWDEALAGFGLRVKPSGAASYLVQYRTPQGATRRLTVGKVGTLTPEEARKLARDALYAVAQGKDPSAERRAARHAETFNDLADAFLESEAWAKKSPASQAIDASRIERHLRPLLGRRALAAISREDMERVFCDIRDGKTALDKPSGKARGRIRVRGGEGAARRTLGLAGALFSFAVRKGWIATNPCRGVETGRDGTREAIVEDADAYARFFKALDDPEIPAAAADALRLIALTGARRGEILGLRWADVDMAHSRLMIDRTQHKAGWRTGKPKVIPLPAAAVAILEALRAGVPGAKPEDFVIKSTKADAVLDLKKVWPRVRAAAKLPADLTIHGLRHSHASHFAMDGASGPEIQAAMGHANIKTSARYIHFAEARRNQLAERAASVATAGMKAAAGKREDEGTG